jgi:hypothetical protein
MSNLISFHDIIISRNGDSNFCLENLQYYAELW